MSGRCDVCLRAQDETTGLTCEDCGADVYAERDRLRALLERLFDGVETLPREEIEDVDAFEDLLADIRKELGK